jgi:UDP-glucose 4-epimerase
VRVLVTGAAGFIGSVTAELMVTRGYDVVALDNLCAGRRENVPAGATFVEGSVGDRPLIRSLGSFDACVHFAAYFAPGESMKSPESFFSNNVSQTFELLEGLIENAVPRFVFSSSCAVYGDRVTVPIGEDHPTSPHSPYGESKLMVEQGLRWLSDLGRIRTASMRYFNAAGATTLHPERHVPEIHLIPIALAAAAKDQDGFDLFGDQYPTRDGTCVRDYVHVTDLAEAHVAAIAALDEHQHLVVNLGTGTGYTNREVLDAVQRVTGRTFAVRVVGPRPGDPAEAVASNTRAREILGWTPTHSSLDEIVADAWAAYQSL